MNIADTATKNESTPLKHWGLILALYLAGIAMGALDTGIVNPARTVIQNSLGVQEQTGVWIFTIYTLAYAAGIPIIGKIADIIGRRPVYILTITLFGIGSLGCGLAQDFASFPLLLISRAVQAVGGGGMVPIATAAIGTIAPKAKRGMALGLVGMIYGVASVFGGSAGSLVLTIAGQDNWQWIFYINLPIALLVIVAGLWALPKLSSERKSSLDLLGVLMLVTMITSLLWSFQHLDFTAFTTSASSPHVWVSFLVFAVLVPVFLVWEKRVQARGGDPLIDLRYFVSLPVAATLLMAGVSGILMMAVMFVPQFAENSMRLTSGEGGYPTIILGLASAFGAPLSGRLTDRFGPRFVLGIGVVVSAFAGLVLIYWTSPHPSFLSATVGLFVMGFGLGFLMGAPLSYLIMNLVPSRDANSGQATMSLTRSVGMTLAPAILVGLLATAMGGLGTQVMQALPQMPAMPASVASSAGGGADGMPSGSAQDSSASSEGFELPPELTEQIQSADVTNIVDRLKKIANYIFDQQGQRIKEASGSVPEAFEQARTDYLQQIDDQAPQIESTFQLALNKGFARLFWFYTATSLAGVLLLFALPSRKRLRELNAKADADS